MRKEYASKFISVDLGSSGCWDEVSLGANLSLSSASHILRSGARPDNLSRSDYYTIWSSLTVHLLWFYIGIHVHI